jgi:hypothetical protein
LLSLKYDNYMNIFVLKILHKNIHMLVLNKYFYKNMKSNLYFGDRIFVNDLFYEYPREYS